MGYTEPTFQLLKYSKHGVDKILNDIPDDLTQYVIDLKTNRRYGTNIGSADVTFNNIPHMFKSSPITIGGSLLIDNMDKVQVLINGVPQFTGFLTDYDTSADNKTAVGTIQDMLCLLKRGINLYPMPSFKYTNVSAIEVIHTLAGLAGVTINIAANVINNDYTISETTLESGSIPYDIISEICDSLGAMLFSTKDGIIKIELLYDGTIPTTLDFDYDDVNHVTTGDRKIQSSLLYPSIWVSNNDDTGVNKGFMFRDINMFHYVNDWDSVLKVDSTFAVNKNASQNIAYSNFMNMWRSSSTGDFTSANGNKDMDVGNIGKAYYDGDIGTYLVIGLTTEFNKTTGYTDSLEIQDTTLKPSLEVVGQMTECATLRQQIIDQIRKYEGVPFEPGAYYRQDQGEWGMVDEALITHVLIDLKMRTADQLTTSQDVIMHEWCIPITEAQLKPGDIFTWNNDLHEMGWYMGNRVICEVWGSILANNTETAMRKHGYVVKEIPIPDYLHPVAWRLKELEACG